MKTKILSIILISFLSSVLFIHTVYSKPDVRIVDNNNPGFIVIPPQYNPDVVIIQQIILDPNNISTFIFNKGIINQDMRLSNTPGFEWPKNNNTNAGIGTFACYTAGLSIAAKINGQLREAMASYAGEYAQGYIDGIGGSVMTDSRFRVYKIKSIDNAGTNPDYADRKRHV